MFRLSTLRRAALLGVSAGAVGWGVAASASTINQNTSWTIDRAGTTTRYSCGDDTASLEKYGNFADPKRKPGGSILTTPVGSFQANAFGLFDMHGNVWEFVADRYQKDYYAKGPVDDPPGPGVGAMRAMRGACWGFDPVRGRSASRGRANPTSRGYRDGFRVAREP